MEPLVIQFQGFVTDLTTVEKRSIVALTEIARDALKTQPHIAPSLASVLVNRILQAPPNNKLPPLYLLDSISKTIGEPYKSYFAPSLPEIFENVWTIGGPSLHKSLDKLLNTWQGVFPQPTIDAVSARRSTIPSPHHAYNIAPTANTHKPMVPDARLVSSTIGTSILPPMYVAPQRQHAYTPHTTAITSSVAPPAPVPDLFSLLASGALANTIASATAMQSAPVTVQPSMTATVAPTTTTTLRANQGRPATLEFSNETLKEHNPAAVDRLMTVSSRTKSMFLDRLFLRRQKRSSGMKASQMWYSDLDMWIASTTGVSRDLTTQQNVISKTGAAALTSTMNAPAGGGSSPQQRYTVAVDPEQTRCALSGEKFSEVWDEDHQEWRYVDARRLTAEEAAVYGLKEGAIVLVSTLGNSGAPPVQFIPIESNGDDSKKEEDTWNKGEPPQKRIKTEK